MRREPYELLVEGETLFFRREDSGSLIEAAETWNQLYHAVGYEWACAVIEGLSRDPLSVVDAACGSGYGSARMAELSCVRSVIGIDISPVQLAYARQWHSVPKVEFVRGDVLHLDKLVPGPGADVIVSFQTIEHLFDPVGFVAAMHRGLKKDGIVLLGTPSHDEPVFLSPDNPYHLVESSQDLLHSLLSFFFSDIRFFDGLPQQEVFERLALRAPDGPPLPNANYAMAARPRRFLSQRRVERFRNEFLLRLWRAGISALQRRAIEERRAEHFLTDCYEFLDLDDGFYQPELKFVWTKEKATLTFHAGSESARCGFTIVPAPPDISEADPVTVRLTDAKGRTTEYHLTKRQGFGIELTCEQGANRFELEVDRTWTPAENGESADIRHLGVRVSDFWLAEDEEVKADDAG